MTHGDGSKKVFSMFILDHFYMFVDRPRNRRDAA
jgi:hypothetical protein